MTSVKLSVTSRRRLEAKYPAAALARIDAAIAAWIAADAARGLATIHVAVDDAAAMHRHGVAPVTGRLTPAKVKKVLDRLVDRLTPDYIAILGADDVIPSFEVGNPSASADDDDEVVLTDNPYACSRPFTRSRRASYLVPDRVVGRIPDLPGANDPKELIRALDHAASATPRPVSDYGAGLFTCCHTWRVAGKACMTALDRNPGALLISPPAKDTSPSVRRRHKRRLVMMKCHGVEQDSRFYGEKSDDFPEILASPSIEGRTSRDAVAAAMCCYGARLYDPADPTIEQPGQPPIPSVYLRQGAHAFFGSTTLAWVGDVTMQCADWVVTGFLKSVLGGASTGRAALEAKQDFLRWLQQQGATPDAADEKTLLQFVLLGDPSIHPVRAASTGAPVPAGPSRAAAAAVRAAALPRRHRRAVRRELGVMLRQALPRRQPGVRPRSMAAGRAATTVARSLMPRRTLGPPARVDRVITTPVVVAPSARVAAAAAGPARAARRPATVEERAIYQYYWTSRRTRGGVPRVDLVTVQVDSTGRIVASRRVVSS